MAPFRSTATMPMIIFLHRHRRGDLAVRLIAHETQILVTHTEQSFEPAQTPALVNDFDSGQRQWLARKQFMHLLEMVLVNVIVAECVNELANLKLADVGTQVEQQRV